MLSVPPSATFHAPVKKIESLSAEHWARTAIPTMGAVLTDDSHVYDFIKNVQGTYAQIVIASGDFRGTYDIVVESIE